MIAGVQTRNRVKCGAVWFERRGKLPLHGQISRSYEALQSAEDCKEIRQDVLAVAGICARGTF